MDVDASIKNAAFSFDISVRELVEFVLRRGDLRRGPSFSSPTRALEGTRGHQKLQSSRPDNYQPEMALKWVEARPNYTLTLRGRVDGVIKEPEEIFLEEIKTVTGEWSRKPSDLHWAQLRVYGGIWNRLNPPKSCYFRLTYYHLETDTEHFFDDKNDPVSAEMFLKEILDSYLNWLDLHVARIIQRNNTIENLAFPFTQLRSGQSSMLEAVRNLHLAGGAKMIEAPTGIGKTMAALFPSIKSLTGEHIRQVLILLARTPGQTVFKEALKLLNQNGGKLKTLSILAREKVCRSGNTVCDPTTCLKRVGYFDRLSEAREAVIHDSPDILDTAVLRELGEKFNLCPHAFASHLAPWMDIVMGDYNYAFDPGAHLSYLFGEEAPRRSKIALLVDESHNLVDRGREMHSQRIHTQTWTPTVIWLQKNEPKGASLLRELWKEMMSTFRPNPNQTARPQTSFHQGELFHTPENLRPAEMTNESLKIHKRVSPYEAVLHEIPNSWMILMESFLQVTEEKLKASSLDTVHENLLDLYFEIHGLLKSARDEGENHQIILKRHNRHVTLHRFCINPSKELSKSWKRAWSTIFFSATLSPTVFYRELLGFEHKHSNLSLPSPFKKSQWQVVIHRGIATTYRKRALSYSDIAQVIHATSQSKQGNYLIFFPSYEYLREVSERLSDFLETTQLETVLMSQTPEMDESSRFNFLKAFKKQDQKTRIGLAVMGGIFGEGIDLVGKSLIGVVVVGVGLPQVCLERDLIREHFDKSGENGFDFAYRHPGINRVMQAVGRLIRTEEDQGIAVLIDQRYQDKSYFTLLPDEWPKVVIDDTKQLNPVIQQFWNSNS